MAFSDEQVPLTPINFFQISADCHYLKHLSSKTFPLLQPAKPAFFLPDTAFLCDESSFAQVAIGWHEEGLELQVSVQEPLQKETAREAKESADRVEIFIDTRDLKTSGFNTKFCHHFFFLAESIEGQQAGEITRFRTDDTHPLCAPLDLQVVAKIKVTGYTLNIFIPQHCLYGYDPLQFNRLGFSYRIHRKNGPPQHFSVVTDDYAIDQHPSLWGSLTLQKDKSPDAKTDKSPGAKTDKSPSAKKDNTGKR